jgi:hypothetical protein
LAPFLLKPAQIRSWVIATLPSITRNAFEDVVPEIAVAWAVAADPLPGCGLLQDEGEKKQRSTEVGMGKCLYFVSPIFLHAASIEQIF